MSDESGKEDQHRATSPGSFPQLKSDDAKVKEKSSNSVKYTENDMPEVFACSLCRKSYASKNHLKRHMKIHVDAQYHCPECGKSFTWKGSLTLHIRTHTKERPYRCEDCGKTFTDRSWLSSHKTTHTGERKYLCEICGELFRIIAILRKHKESVHDFDKECEICQAKFMSKKEWREHMKENESHRQFPCPHCHRRFATVHLRYNHIRYFHLKKRPKQSVRNLKSFLCDPCGKAYSSRSLLRRHNAVHHMPKDERPRFSCKKCSKSFLTRKSIREHPCIDRFICWICRKKFKTRKEMELHKENHTIEEIKKFLCKECGKRFNKPNLLKRHKCEPEVPEAKPQLVVQVLNSDKVYQHAYCKRCLVTFPSKYSVHVCAPPHMRKSAKKNKKTIQKKAIPNPNAAVDHASAGFENSGAAIKMESASSAPYTIAEIKQEFDGSGQSNQEMTFFFKIEDGSISIIRP